MRKIVIISALLVLGSYNAVATVSKKDSITRTPSWSSGFFFGAAKVLGNNYNQPCPDFGAVFNKGLNKNLFLSFDPSISFFSYISPVNEKQINNTYLEIPISLVLKPTTWGPILNRIYYGIGPGYKLDMVHTNQSFFAANCFIGVPYYLRGFIFAPQISYSYSSRIQSAYVTMSFIGR